MNNLTPLFASSNPNKIHLCSSSNPKSRFYQNKENQSEFPKICPPPFLSLTKPPIYVITFLNNQIHYDLQLPIASAYRHRLFAKTLVVPSLFIHLPTCDSWSLQFMPTIPMSSRASISLCPTTPGGTPLQQTKPLITRHQLFAHMHLPSRKLWPPFLHRSAKLQHTTIVARHRDLSLEGGERFTTIREGHQWDNASSIWKNWIHGKILKDRIRPAIRDLMRRMKMRMKKGIWWR